jgi:hypothetical protein
VDWSSLIPWMCQSLNAPNVAQLQNWTAAELYQYAEESLRALGGKAQLIVELDESIALVADQAFYEVPAGHIATIYAAADGVMLKPSSVAEVEALDDNYEEAASDTPTRWIGDSLGLGLIRTYPAPDATGTLTLIFQKDTPDLTAAAAEVKIPAPIGDYLSVKALQQARERQGDGQMKDAAAALGLLGGLYEKAAEAYWGKA